MKEWIPFLQELVWPLFLAVLVLLARGPLKRLLKAFEDRVAAGAEFEAGTSGIRVGAVPKLAEMASSPLVSKTTNAHKSGVDLPPSDIYLVHTAHPASRNLYPDDHRQLFEVRIFVDADDPGILDQVTEITYFLHETFKEPVMTIRNRRNSFELVVVVWGEFNVAAVVRFKDGRELRLERYLNL